MISALRMRLWFSNTWTSSTRIQITKAPRPRSVRFLGSSRGMSDSEVLPKVVTLNALYSAGLRYIELPSDGPSHLPRQDRRAAPANRAISGSCRTSRIRSRTSRSGSRIHSPRSTAASIVRRRSRSTISTSIASLGVSEQGKFSSFQRNQLWVYRDLSRILDEFVSHYGLGHNFTRKEIDKFLWFYGRERHKAVAAPKAA